MSQQTHRANLSSAIFPMTLAKAGRSVIVSGADQNFDRRIDPSGISNAKAVGIPQAIYMENVFPTPDGFQSVGFKPQTSITTPGTINALQQVYFATVKTTVTDNADIVETDDGDQIETWITSAFQNSFDGVFGDTNTRTDSSVVPAVYLEVVESSGIGNPVNSYRFSSIAQVPGFSVTPAKNCYAYKDFNLSSATTITAECDIRFVTGTSTSGTPPAFIKLVDLAIGVDSTGKGIRVVYESLTDTFTIRTSPGYLNSDSQVIQATGTVTTPLAYATWYTVQISVTVNADFTISVVATIKDTTLVTTFASVSGVIPATTVIGDWVGINHSIAEDPLWSSVDSATMSPNRLFVDNLSINGTVPDISTDVYSGVRTLYIAHHSNNTCTWSYDLITWDNNPVTEGTFTSPLTDSEVSHGFARGRGFICVRTGGVTKIYELSISGGTTLVFTDQTTVIAGTLPLGFAANDILGIVSSYNYLILYTATTVLWSSTTTPTDFSESLVSGAGNEIPGNLKGDITFCKEHLAGFFIYTAKNVVFAVYTGNSRYPWKFREVGGSSGYDFSTQIAGSTNAGAQYGLANTKYLQEMVPDGATPLKLIGISSLLVPILSQFLLLELF
jgi:hypothetical protein